MTRNLRSQLASEAERWIRAWSRPDVSREDAAVMVTYWHLYEPSDPELVDDVLSRFPASEPPAVPGLDFLPAVEADAKAIVATTAAGWDDDTSRCARCGTAYSPSYATHCVPCDGPMWVVS